MNQATANKLNEEGGIILIMDMPKGTAIGLDYNTWLVGDNFLGFKMVNPGFHCLFYNSVGKENDFSPRTIIPLMVHSKEVKVFQYDPKEEVLLSEEKMNEEEVRKYKSAGSSFAYDSQTAPYPFETMSKWMNLTNHITDNLFNQLTNTSSISFILDTESDHLYNYTTTINITEIIKPTRDSSLYPPSYITQLYVDSSDELLKLSEQYSSKHGLMNIVGEFEFSFLMFHLGEDFESFLQWKNILFLITRAYTLLTLKDDVSICAFYKAIMKVLYLQLSELEDDFFTLTDGSEGKPKSKGKSKLITNKTNFVIKCLEVKALNTIIIEDPDEVISPEDLYFPKIQELLQKRFQIELEDSYDCPTIME